MTRVLVVEDEPINLKLVVEILTVQGFKVQTAIDGYGAIKKIENEFYDVIIMDIELPGMDGIKTTNLIKKKHEYKNVPVIALTAYAMKGDKEKILAAGLDDYISKPIDVLEFMKKMENYKKIDLNTASIEYYAAAQK